MIFEFWKRKRKSNNSPPSVAYRARSTASFGGMQERVLQARLEILVDAVLTRHRSVIAPARELSKLSLLEQERFLSSVDRISLHDQELAFHFCQLATPALLKLCEVTWEPWIDSLLETFRSRGLDASIADIENFQRYQEKSESGSGSVSLKDVSRVLDIFIRALNGRELKIAAAEQSYTDTETLFLPAHINHFPTRDENFLLYKSLIVHQWAQTWFGTWHVDLVQALKDYPDQEYALKLFHSLETLRLDACLIRELPGIARQMMQLRNEPTKVHPQWLEAMEKLQQPEANVKTTLDILSRLYSITLQPAYALYQGQLQTTLTTAVIRDRNKRDQETLQRELKDLHEAITKQDPEISEQPSSRQSRFRVTQHGETDDDLQQIQLEYDGNAVDITPELKALLDSITQDNAEIPEHYLDPFDDDKLDEHNETNETGVITADNKIHDFSYSEWDHSLQRYRDNWCQMHEKSVTPVNGVFVTETLNKYQLLLKQLRRTFEAMRQENQKIKREPFGDDLDIDAIVEAWADTHNGLEASDHVFIQTRREDRNVAVMFMIDMSASTAGWINHVQREALVLLCDVLELLGDRYAIYGFSGHSNNNCQCFHIKDFSERYNDEVRHRIEGIEPQDHTRMGAAIRHLGYKLSLEEARTRLLITLSDGRPDDVGGYRGHYGIEDTRMALIEIKHMGINPYCITIDTDAREYLPHMFGKNDFTIIDQVDALPRRIADIYRRLTH